MPDGLTFTAPQAWQGRFPPSAAPRVSETTLKAIFLDIYGMKANKRQLEKDRDFFVDAPEGIPSIIHSSDEDHHRIRTLVSYAFSGTALREHEPLIKYYSDRLVTKLSQKISGSSNGVIDATQWLNFTSFDLITRLTVDDCFNLLEKEKFNFWTDNVFKGIKLLRYLRVIHRYPPLWYIFDTIVNTFPRLRGIRNAHMEFGISKAEARLERGSDIKDFMSYVCRPQICRQNTFKLTRDS